MIKSKVFEFFSLVFQFLCFVYFDFAVRDCPQVDHSVRRDRPYHQRPRYPCHAENSLKLRIIIQKKTLTENARGTQPKLAEGKHLPCTDCQKSVWLLVLRLDQDLSMELCCSLYIVRIFPFVKLIVREEYLLCELEYHISNCGEMTYASVSIVIKSSHVPHQMLPKINFKLPKIKIDKLIHRKRGPNRFFFFDKTYQKRPFSNISLFV